jgi:PKD repeat protein
VSIDTDPAKATGFVPFAVDFEAVPDNNCDEPIIYTWTFGDKPNRRVIGNPVSHLYINPGVYTVTVTAFTGNGQTVTATTKVTVKAATLKVTLKPAPNPAGPPPVVVTYTVTVAAVPPAVATPPYDWTLKIYSSKFQPLQTASGKSNAATWTIKVNYASAGSFTAEIQVTDAAGNGGGAQAMNRVTKGGGGPIA